MKHVLRVQGGERAEGTELGREMDLREQRSTNKERPGRTGGRANDESRKDATPRLRGGAANHPGSHVNPRGFGAFRQGFCTGTSWACLFQPFARSHPSGVRDRVTLVSPSSSGGCDRTVGPPPARMLAVQSRYGSRGRNGRAPASPVRSKKSRTVSRLERVVRCRLHVARRVVPVGWVGVVRGHCFTGLLPCLGSKRPAGSVEARNQ